MQRLSKLDRVPHREEKKRISRLEKTVQDRSVFIYTQTIVNIRSQVTILR